MVLYNAFVILFDYCDVVWDPTSSMLSDSIDRLHRRVLTLINDPDLTDRTPQSLVTRRKFHLATQVFKCRNLLSPPY